MEHPRVRPVIERFYRDDSVARKMKDCDCETVLHNGLAILKALAPCWLSAGTLLGIYRDGGPMPDDDDLDLGAMTIGAERERSLSTVMKCAGFVPWRRMTSNGKLMQRCFLHVKERCLFDIYFFEREGDELVNYNYLGVLRKPAGLFDPMGFHFWRDRPYPVPNDIERYLEVRYGKDWKTPKERPPGSSWGQFAANLEKW